MLIIDTPLYQVYQYSLGQLQANCYLLVHVASHQTWIIDPGDEGDFISEEILRADLQPTLILLTHAHYDHLGGVLPLKLNFAVPVAVSFADLPLYKKAGDSALFWQQAEIDPLPPPDLDLAASATALPAFPSSSDWQILSTPGHTPGSICLYSPTQELLFTGDTLFAGTIGRTDFSYSSPEKMLTSLQTLISLPDETLVLPGHGAITSIAQELQNVARQG